MSRSNGKVSDAADSSDDNVVETTPLQPYKVMVSLRFMILTMTASILGAFAVGQLARFMLLEKHGHKRHTDRNRGNGKHLPPPIAKDGKDVPPTIYTAKNFDTARTASSSLLIRRDEDSYSQSKQQSCSTDEQSCRAKAKEILPSDDEHLPAGQHLLVDMKGLEAAFLNSEERLAYAMVEVVNQASLTLLSYHCHTLLPSGVSCVGVLLESHVSFHTWPSAGVITLDLFTCGSNPLVPVVPMIERLFGVPASLNEPPKVVWSHKLRGFRKHRSPLQMWDLGVSVLSTMDMDLKKEVR
jgi:S-adenosylmethionine decarboxylase proenzyme